MGTVLIAWELGGGLGHLMQLAPIARGLAARGHRVFAALRYLDWAERVFGCRVATLLSAPWATTPAERQVKPPVNWAHILHNMGWHDGGQLRGLLAAWRGLFELVKPDVVIFDHAPTALLAARGLPPGKAVIGSGFCVPPDEVGRPLRNLRPWVKANHGEPAAVQAFEREMLGRVNGILRDYGAPALERVTQLYGEADETFLATVPELDHYGVRAGANYWGPFCGIGNHGGGVIAERPLTPAFSPEYSGAGGRTKLVFAYLKNFPALPALIDALEAGGHPTVAVCDGVPADVRAKFAAARFVRVADGPLDLGHVVRECDLAVLNAGHGATAAMLRAGVPALLVPIHLEQGMLARAAVRNTGAVVEASYKDGDALVRRLNEMLQPGNFERHREAARQFAAKYEEMDEGTQVERLVARVEELMEQRGRGGDTERGRQGDKETGGQGERRAKVFAG
jgi:hypothetical protein